MRLLLQAFGLVLDLSFGRAEDESTETLTEPQPFWDSGTTASTPIGFTPQPGTQLEGNPDRYGVDWD